jgi:hypothetical protein
LPLLLLSPAVLQMAAAARNAARNAIGQAEGGQQKTILLNAMFTKTAVAVLQVAGLHVQWFNQDIKRPLRILALVLI